MPGLICDVEGEVLDCITYTLGKCQPYPGNGVPVDRTYLQGEVHFIVEKADDNLVCISNWVQGFKAYLWWDLAKFCDFSIGKWFAKQCAIMAKADAPWFIASEWMVEKKWSDTTTGQDNRPIEQWMPYGSDSDDSDDKSDDLDVDGANSNFDTTEEDGDGKLELGVIQVDQNKYVAVQWNTAQVKSSERLLPKPIIIKVSIDSHPARALVDLGSLGDFVSSTLVDQLKLKHTLLDKAVGLQLAVQGSRSRINSVVSMRLTYQNIDEAHHFDVVNLNEYDVILGTPWMYQHQVCIGLNPARIVIGSNKPTPITPGVDTKYLLGALSFAEPEIVSAREELMAYADPLC